MIKAEELRIKNWVSEVPKPDKEDYAPWCHTVVNIESYPEEIIYVDNGDGFSSESVYPIELSPDILEKMGFEKSQEGLFILQIKDNLWLEICLGGRTFLTTNQGEYIIDDTMIMKYVHQIQNFFHSLTGEELTINLTSNTTVKTEQ